MQKTILVLVVAGVAAAANASSLDPIGVTLLRATTTNLNGSGVRVGQAEAGDGVAANWEVNPASIGAATNLFTYIYGTSPYLTVSTTNSYPNSIGSESGHGGFVAGYFYGITNFSGFVFGVSNGVATNVAHVDNYEANTFINYYISGGHSISERVVNQSFTFGSYNTGVDQLYDNYADANEILFLSGADGQPIYSPASCYNGIGVGSLAFTNGPTADGRSKPDIIVSFPSETSYTTAQVSGAAAILMQAGTRGDGGSDTNSATDIRTVKALLLNGAIKPVGWTNSSSQPLHRHYGAGVLNVFNSYKQLAGGKRGSNFSTNVPTDTAHLPVAMTNSVPVLSGWNFTNITASVTKDAVHHYFFNATNSSSNAAFTATITLAWNKQSGQTALNNLNLFLYNCANSNLVACSTSLVDNVEHIFMLKLPQGRYDLQVWKAGGAGTVSTSETYALAWEFFSESIGVAKSGTNLNLSWPVYPDGFVVESTANLSSPSWSASSIPSATITNNQNKISVGIANTNKFFRLRRP
ncbi:MAG TPA: S8 family serine peptidase [Candidatus Baltobacteraceae bacterium]|nr:S8 family serine peptidase [Candidatus Baltobacteraceae bacterium]